MALPITLGLFLFSLGRDSSGGRRNWRGRLTFFGSARGHVAFLYGLLALLLLVGVIFTRSRAGIALTMLGVLLATFAFARRIGGDNVYGPAGTVAALAMGLGIVIGLAPVLDRFAELDPMEDLRWTMFAATVEGIGAFFPLGSGPGTYAAVFPAFQPVELGRWFVNYAHNDYLQWLFEGGLPVAVLFVLLLGLYLYQWSKVWTREAWSQFRFVQVGAGIGVLLMLLHELVDYNLHMPANMVYFAFLAGIFFSDPDLDSVAGGQRRKRRRTPDLVPAEAVPVPVRPVGPHPEQIPNPFLD
jgi:O-antigen ligase